MKPESTADMRIGRIKYINTLPFYHKLFTDDDRSVEIYENCPAKINYALRHKKVDIAPISSLEYLNHQSEYVLLPDLAIGSRDFSKSVLLFSRDKLEGLDGATIALTRESLSSAVLLRILMKFKYKFKNRFVSSSADIETTLEKYPAALVIGDEALLYQPREFVYKYDLSELWWNWTEKPFCFSLWAVRKQFARDEHDRVTEFYFRLVENLNHNLSDLETLIKNAMHMSFLDATFPKIFGYLFNLSYGLDASMQEGLLLYYRLAHRLGVSPIAGNLEFFEFDKKAASKKT